MHIHIRFSSTKKHKKYGAISMHIYRDRTKLIITAETLRFKQWESPAPQAAIRYGRQSHGIAPESGASRYRPSIHIPSVLRRRCPLPDSPYNSTSTINVLYIIIATSTTKSFISLT